MSLHAKSAVKKREIMWGGALCDVFRASPFTLGAHLPAHPRISLFFAADSSVGTFLTTIWLIEVVLGRDFVVSGEAHFKNVKCRSKVNYAFILPIKKRKYTSFAKRF